MCEIIGECIIALIIGDGGPGPVCVSHKVVSVFGKGDGYLPRHCPQACYISGKTFARHPSVIYLLKALDERITFLGCLEHQTFTEKSLVLGRDAPFIKSLHTTISEMFMSEILENSMQIFIAYLEFLGHKLSNAPT